MMRRKARATARGEGEGGALDASLQDPEVARRKFRSRSILKTDDGVVDTTSFRERASERQLQLEAMGLAAEAEGARATRRAAQPAAGGAAAALAAAAPASVGSMPLLNWSSQRLTAAALADRGLPDVLAAVRPGRCGCTTTRSAPTAPPTSARRSARHRARGAPHARFE